MPTEETVTDSDGTTGQKCMDLMFRFLRWMKNLILALIGEKGKWNDHRVSVSSPEKMTEQEEKATKTPGEETGAAEEAASGEAEKTAEAEKKVELEEGI